MPRPAPPEEIEELSERERDVFRLMARGLSNAEIGRDLYISETTVKTHVQRILASRRPRPEHVEAHARNDGRQPAPETGDVAHVAPAQPNPGFLDGILRFARRPEHAIRHGAQMRPVLLESISEPLACCHRHRVLWPPMFQ